jgi:hypothetical protein
MLRVPMNEIEGWNTIIGRGDSRMEGRQGAAGREKEMRVVGQYGRQ